MRRQIMVDIETLGLSPRSAITQIAAVSFNLDGRFIILDRFDVGVCDTDGDVNLQTIAWWLQNASAPALGIKIEMGHKLRDALEVFGKWVGRELNHHKAEGVWAHGAAFDPAVISEACRRAGVKDPIPYRSVRDTRTVYSLLPSGEPPKVDRDPNRVHDALYDCEVQALQLYKAIRKLGV